MHTVRDTLVLESYIASKLANAEFGMEMGGCLESPAGWECLLSADGKVMLQCWWMQNAECQQEALETISYVTVIKMILYWL